MRIRKKEVGSSEKALPWINISEKAAHCFIVHPVFVVVCMLLESHIPEPASYLSYVRRDEKGEEEEGMTSII